ncbi:hypothetical protein BT69DRAFT_1318855 [Atractiella rhizophila]|nr:hypothetical protein BT69DRAFT_1318855 [Atractiella rhizophila]
MEHIPLTRNGKFVGISWYFTLMPVQLAALCSEDEERNGMGEEWFKGNTYLQLSVPVYKNREERENF